MIPFKNFYVVHCIFSFFILFYFFLVESVFKYSLHILVPFFLSTCFSVEFWQWLTQNSILAVEEDAESEDEEEEDVKLLSMSGKRSAPGGGGKVPQVRVGLPPGTVLWPSVS